MKLKSEWLISVVFRLRTVLFFFIGSEDFCIYCEHDQTLTVIFNFEFVFLKCGENPFLKICSVEAILEER